MAQSNELRVFISSTFRDLQEEREHLVKKIFPEIRALCRERGVAFTDIDLRWGITEEEAEREGIIRICLDEIDRCRPYFIGILGQRYGWTPPRSDAERVAGDYPILADAMLQGASITEMEIVHGVLANPAMAGHAFFYFRDRAATPAEFVDRDPDAISRLDALKDRIRQSGFPVREDFAGPAELGAWLEEDLRRLVDMEYPESEAPSALELERRAHRAFAASRTRAYIPNPLCRDRFNAWVEGLGGEQDAANDNNSPLDSRTPKDPTSAESHSLTPFVISGASGLGKSSLVAYLVDTFRRTHPTAFVVEHYVGASRSSGSATSIMRHIVEEIRERFGISDELPARPDELEQSFANWLFRAEHYAKQSGIEMLVVVDAVNQLDEAGRRLSWLPKTIPAGIRLLVSTTPGECAERLAERSWATLVVAPIDDQSTREQIVGRYLGEFRKRISNDQTRRLATDPKASSPLCLRVVAEELRLHGEHETLDEVIDRYVGAEDLLDVFARVLGRFERDYGVATVEPLMTLLWASRSGLSEVEMMDVAGLSRIDLSRLLFAFDYHFLQRDGLLGFFHDCLRRAVEQRYLPDAPKQRSTHVQLAEYFQRAVTASIGAGGAAPNRMAAELAYQLHAAGAKDRLQECLSTMEVFLALYDGETQYDVMTYWSAMPEGTDIEGNYRRGVDRWVSRDAGERTSGLGLVANLLERLGRWGGAIELARERLALAIAWGGRREVADARTRIGFLLQLRGAFGEAMEELEQAVDLYTELGHQRGIAGAIGNMGLVYSRRGEYDRALECFERVLGISEELGDRDGAAGATGNIGLVYDSRGEYDRALEYYERCLSIFTELGHRLAAASAHGNIGIVYINLGQLDRAIESFERQLGICTDVGNRSGISLAVGNMGLVYFSRGEYDRALECFRRQSNICAEMGDRRVVSIAIGNMGNVHYRRGEYDRALETYHHAAEEHRSIGFHYGLTYWLDGTARVLVALAQEGGAMPEYLPKYVPDVTEDRWRVMALRQARNCAEECVAISDDISQPDTQFNGRVVLARIEALQGHHDSARERLEAMLQTATDADRSAELHYRLWQLGAPGHAEVALGAYKRLYEETPTSDYKERIDELTAGGDQT